MATAIGTTLIAKECAYTSTATYYAAVLEAISKSAGVLTFGVKLTVTTGSGTELGSGAGNTRTAYVYDAAGNLLGSALIKDASTGWYASSNYSVTVPCTANVGTAAGTLSGCYIRILHSLTSEYGNVASCYWNGSCKYNASVGNTFSIDHDSSYSKTITLRFDARGGSGAPADQSATVYSQGATASFTIPQGYPTKAGMICYGWGVDPGAEDYWEGDTIELGEDLTLFAVWVKPITIHYDQNGGSGVSIPDKKDEFYETDGYAPITITTTKPVRSGYTFMGWGTTSSDTSVNYVPGTTYHITSSNTLYAIWMRSVTLSFNANGGTNAPVSVTQSVYYDNSATFVISNSRPVREGHTFLGWGTSATDLTVDYMPGDTCSIQNSTTLYAIWEANEYTYNVIHVSDSGAALGSGKITRPYGTSIEFAPHQKTGYITPPKQTIVWDSTTPKNIEYVFVRIHYDIEYDVLGGTMPAQYAKTYTIEDRVDLPVPARVGYAFEGWFEDDELIHSIEAGTTGEKQLTASWKSKAHLFQKVDGQYKHGPTRVKFDGVWKKGKLIFQKIAGHWRLPTDMVFLDEDFSDFVNSDTVITDTPSKPGHTSWNGATPPSKDWSLTVNSGQAIFQPHIEGDGNACIKLSPLSTGGRMQIVYTLPQALYNLLHEGKQYTVHADFRGSNDADFQAQIQAVCITEENKILKYTLTENWKTASYTFTFSKERGLLKLVFGIAYPGGTTGSIYIDNVRMT